VENGAYSHGKERKNTEKSFRLSNSAATVQAAATDGMCALAVVERQNAGDENMMDNAKERNTLHEVNDHALTAC
jgi:hypothetical protein